MKERKKTWLQKCAIVSASYERVKNELFFSSDFYSNLFFLSPKLKKYFAKTDFVHQEKALLKAMNFLMEFFDTKNSYAKLQVKRIALSHSREGLNIHPHSYYYWIEAMIMTVKTYDPYWYDDMEYYWREVLNGPISYIISQYYQEVKD